MPSNFITFLLIDLPIFPRLTLSEFKAKVVFGFVVVIVADTKGKNQKNRLSIVVALKWKFLFSSSLFHGSFRRPLKTRKTSGVDRKLWKISRHFSSLLCVSWGWDCDLLWHSYEESSQHFPVRFFWGPGGNWKIKLATLASWWSEIYWMFVLLRLTLFNRKDLSCCRIRKRKVYMFWEQSFF